MYVCMFIYFNHIVKKVILNVVTSVHVHLREFSKLPKFKNNSLIVKSDV